GRGGVRHLGGRGGRPPAAPRRPRRHRAGAHGLISPGAVAGDPAVTSRRHHGRVQGTDRWPSTAGELVQLQDALARDADAVLEVDPWAPPERLVVGGCFVAFARGEAGPGHPGDRAWAAAVSWRADAP